MKTFFSYLASTAVLFCVGQLSTPQASADEEFANSGLVLQWEANIGGGPLANGSESLRFWAHTSDVTEIVNFYSNGKLVKVFKSDDIDDAQLEETLVSGRSTLETPRIGLEGAIKKAEKLATLYQKIGRKTDIEKVVSRSYYAVAITDTGIITALDAEKGSLLWRRELPHSSLPVFGPAISDDYVAAINGHEFFVYRLKDGNLISRRKLKHVATGKPIIFRDKIGVPSTGGRLMFYDILDYKIAEEMIRVGGENRVGVANSADGQFITWPINNRLVVTKMESPPLLWYSIDAGNGSVLPSLPMRLPDGFLVASHNGTVSRYGLDRLNPFRWKVLLGTTCNQSPVIGQTQAAIVSQDSRLFMIDLTKGQLAWASPLRGISSALTVTEKHVYAIDTAKNLVTIEAATGRVLARTQIGPKTPIPNSSTDRVVFVDQLGMLTCLREPQAVQPTLIAPFLAAPTDAEPTPDEAADESAGDMDQENSEFGDDFDSNDFGFDADSEDTADETEDDPFAAF